MDADFATQPSKSQTQVQTREYNPRLLMDFEIVGAIREVETIATGSAVRTRKHLWRKFGRDHWRKMKGIAEVRYADGSVWLTELHWYEAHGIGRKLFKAKRRLHRL